MGVNMTNFKNKRLALMIGAAVVNVAVMNSVLTSSASAQVGNAGSAHSKSNRHPLAKRR